MLDLDGYFARIGYSGPRAATLATLRAIHALHPLALPFENIDPFLGRPVRLDLETLQEKMIRHRRGGYCFEHNTLFKAALERLGFKVSILAARVAWMMPRDAPPNPRTHMSLKVDLDEGSYIADVGFGGSFLSAPLKLICDAEQATPTGMLRLRRAGMFFNLQTMTGDAWRDVYRFTLEPIFPIDIEVGNWFTSAHPRSAFRNRLLIQRMTRQGGVSLRNTLLTRRGADGREEKTALTDAQALGRALADDFLIDPPEEAEAIFARLPPP